MFEHNRALRYWVLVQNKHTDLVVPVAVMAATPADWPALEILTIPNNILTILPFPNQILTKS